MALPVAPLGSLPNMNLPYSRPYYEKTSTVDKALAAFLTGLAANAGGQVVENAMSRDFAEQPAGFWSKLVKGPEMNRQQFEAQAERQAGKEALERQVKSREELARLDREQRMGMFEREMSDKDAARGLQRTLFDLEQENRRRAMAYETERALGLAELQRQGQLQNAMYGATLDDWLNERKQTRANQLQMDFIRGLGAGQPKASTSPASTRPTTPTMKPSLRERAGIPQLPNEVEAQTTSTAPNRTEFSARYSNLPTWLQGTDQEVAQGMAQRGASPEVIQAFLEQRAVLPSQPGAGEFLMMMAENLVKPRVSPLGNPPFGIVP